MFCVITLHRASWGSRVPTSRGPIAARTWDAFHGSRGIISALSTPDAIVPPIHMQTCGRPVPQRPHLTPKASTSTSIVAITPLSSSLALPPPIRHSPAARGRACTGCHLVARAHRGGGPAGSADPARLPSHDLALSSRAPTAPSTRAQSSSIRRRPRRRPVGGCQGLRSALCVLLCLTSAFLYSGTLCQMEAAWPLSGLSRLGSPSRLWIDSRMVRTL